MAKARKPQGKLRRLYDAHENLEKNVAQFFSSWSDEDSDVSGLVCVLEETRNEVEQVAEEYRESASAFPNGGGIADALEEKADMVESWASALDDAANGIEEWREESALFDPEDVERREGESDEDYAARVEEAREEAVREAREEWREEVRRLAEDALGEYPL